MNLFNAHSALSGIVRIATNEDIDSIADTYTRLLEYEQIHESYSNWQLGVYPTQKVARTYIAAKMMYVVEHDKQICGSMVLNSEQAPEYINIAWKHYACPEQILVIHTLCVPPDKSGKGYATKMLEFAKTYAREHGFNVIRIDTYAGNKPAIDLYVNNGFTVAGHGNIVLHGLIHEPQIYLEYLVRG